MCCLFKMLKLDFLTRVYKASCEAIFCFFLITYKVAPTYGRGIVIQKDVVDDPKPSFSLCRFTIESVGS